MPLEKEEMRNVSIRPCAELRFLRYRTQGIKPVSLDFGNQGLNCRGGPSRREQQTPKREITPTSAPSERDVNDRSIELCGLGRVNRQEIWKWLMK